MSSAKAKVEGGELLELPGIAAQSKSAPTLYHFPISLGSQQVRLVLAEKQVAWDGQIVNTGPALENLEPWYAKLNPQLVVPTLVVGTTIVTGAVQIVGFVNEHFPGPELLPSEPEQRDEVLRWIEIQDQFPLRELGYARTKGMVRWFQRWSLRQQRSRLRRLIRKNPELRDIYEAKRAELDGLERGIHHRIGMSELVDEVEVLLDEIEVTLEQREWLAGPNYTLADAMWTAVLSKLEQIGFARSLRSHRRPEVARWYAQLRERPSWDSMIRRLSAWQVLRFYGPSVAKTFLLFWVLKWMIVIGLGWLVAHLRG
ncbi:glutathione S-transferase family protein [Enhygromyxa salina]|uniref:glutathione S-transferase family protein n=1 Tax=Enhygromyxa salina TaxID=215803 RepID=UPI0015E7A5CF|nr:glutathione S-transferase family protein [Enhygromyxa salina]